MTRSHRIWHRRVWIVMAIAVGTGFVLALALRPSPAATPTVVVRGVAQ